MRGVVVLFVAGLSSLAAADEPSLAAAQMRFASADGFSMTVTPAATEIELDVNVVVIEGTVRQRFRNLSSHFVEATWIQALPADATVHDFEVRIGERRLVGELEEGAVIKSSYFDRPVENHHANRFSTSVAHVAPGEWVSVELRYSQTVSYQDGVFALEFPLATQSKSAQPRAGICTSVAETGPEACSAANPTLDVSVRINPGLNVKRLDSATHNIAVAYAGATLEVALQTGPLPNDRDFELRWEPEPASAPNATLMTDATEVPVH